MFIKTITIKSGLFGSETIEFEKNTLVNGTNGIGKTTLLKSIIYGFGFNLPSFEFAFQSEHPTVLVVENNNQEFRIERNRDQINVYSKTSNLQYTIPDSEKSVLSYIFGINNYNILDFILKIFYFDQESGSSTSKIELKNKKLRKLFFSILGMDEENLLVEVDTISSFISSYKSAEKIFTKNLAIKDSNITYEQISKKIDFLKFQSITLRRKIKSIDKLLDSNTSLIEFIEDLGLTVSKNGTEIPVNSKTLKYFSENKQALISRKENLIYEKKTVDTELNKLNVTKTKIGEKFKAQQLIDSLSLKLINVIPDFSDLHEDLEVLTAKKKHLLNQISKNNVSLESIMREFHEYLCFLSKNFNIQPTIKESKINFILKNPYKDYSGSAILRLDIAIKLSFIKLINRHYKIALPIIIDSPQNMEMEVEKVNEILSFIQQEFSEHQIIVASIHNYKLPNTKVIHLTQRLLQ